MGWLSELDVGEYFSSVGNSFKKFFVGTGKMVGETAGGIVGGVLSPIGNLLKKTWVIILSVTVLAVLLLLTPIGKKILGRFFK